MPKIPINRTKASKPWDKPPYWLVPCDDAFCDEAKVKAEALALHKKYEAVKRMLENIDMDEETIRKSITKYLMPLLQHDMSDRNSLYEEARRCSEEMLLPVLGRKHPQIRSHHQEKLREMLIDFHQQFAIVRPFYYHRNLPSLDALNDPDFYKQVVAIEHNIRHITQISAHSFHDRLYRELRKRGRQLGSFEQLVRKESETSDFDAKRLFMNSGLGQGVVIANDCFILPLFTDQKIIGTQGETTIDMFSYPRQIAGHGYGFDFVYKPLGDEKNASRLLIPVMYLDTHILSLLDSSAHGSSILKNFRAIAKCANHDWYHHTVPVNQTTGVAALDNFQAPLHAIKGELRPHMIALDKLPSSSKSNYEELANFTNREVWKQIFSEKPELKQRLLQRVANFLSDLKELKKELVEKAHTHPGEANHAAKLAQADNVVSYLALIGIERFHSVIAPDDNALKQPVIRHYGESGKIPDAYTPPIHQLIAELELAPPSEKSVDWFKTHITNTPSQGDNSGVKPYPYDIPEVLRTVQHYVSGNDTSPWAAFQARLVMESYSPVARLHDTFYEQQVLGNQHPAYYAAIYDTSMHDGESGKKVDCELTEARTGFAKTVHNRSGSIDTRWRI